nr:lactate racemase domain-containing protein [Kribbella solani]
MTEDEVTAFIGDALAGAGLAGRSVCVIVPDATRSCPLPLLLKAVTQALKGSQVTILVALGTHAEMTAEQLRKHLGDDYPNVLNHEWWNPETFAGLGTISSARVGEISAEMLRDEVPVRLNRAVVEHDVALVVGPVFPHEVVGFSGGNKYFFPGVAGQEVIDLSHWLGALITSANIIGTPGITPVRALIDEAAAMIPAEKLALSVVAQSGTDALHAIAFGDTTESWRAAAEISAQTHVRYLDRPVRRVVSVMPAKYADIWTAAKGFYKVEPIVADGGEVILYAPHVTELAAMHPEIARIGYHCRDYFLGQWEQFRDLHWGVLAHSTHLRGAGTWDPATGEHLRVQVTLATGIAEDVVRGANLGYLDPATIDLTAYEADPDTFVVPNAGETLYRLKE